jgi:hypothetical protein
MTNFEYAMRVYSSIEADKAEILRIMEELYKLDRAQELLTIAPLGVATVKESLTVPDVSTPMGATVTPSTIGAYADPNYPRMGATVAAKPKIEIISQQGLECVESELVPPVPPSVFSGDNQAHKDLLKPIFKKCEMDLRKESDKNLATKMKLQLEGCPLHCLESSALVLHSQLTGKDVELDPGF